MRAGAEMPTLAADGPTITNPKALCLNMIVKNEMANLERCLRSVADYIACWVIGDTGSTDGTQDFIASFFADRGIPGELHSFPFENFEQARNAALDCAYASPLAYDYLLLTDADMELVVEDRDFRSKLDAPAYKLLQRSSMTYWNSRLARRDAGAHYRGVTHEYLEVREPGTRLYGVWFKDHATGANRKDKFERDIRLLLEALKQEPENTRYWFYLAQSYRDSGRFQDAADAYTKRIGTGGSNEEVWYSRLQRARCLRELKDESGFIREAIEAFNARPHRAEPLYDLARFYRERGMTQASVLFAEEGLAIPWPEQDMLFILHFVYTWGLHEEYSIAANYSGDPVRKERGHAACNWLALNRTIPARPRDLARWNLFFYLKPANALMPSFAAQPVGFTPPDAYRLAEASVARRNGELLLLQRAVNFAVADDGQYRTANDEPIHARNFLLRLTDDLNMHSSSEILPPTGKLDEAGPLASGYEDLRLFAWRDALWCSAISREPTPDGWCQHVLARIDDGVSGASFFTECRPLHARRPARPEKNWIPRATGDTLQFISRCDPTRIVDDEDRTITETAPAIAAEQFDGASQTIAFDGGWLALVRELSVRDKRRYCQHRFVWFDGGNALRRLSRAFYLNKQGTELVGGLAWHPDGERLVLSFGVDGRESWLATVQASEVGKVLEDAEQLPSGSPVSPARASAPASPPALVRSGRAFALFDTLVARRCVYPRVIFEIVERASGRPGFTEARVCAEADLDGKTRNYTIDDIYRELAANFSISEQEAERLKSLELATEQDNLFAIAEHCREVGPDDVVVSDTYLPGSWLIPAARELCRIRPRMFALSSRGKRTGAVWPALRGSVQLTEHLGADLVTDVESARLAGIPARLTTVARRTRIEDELADRGFVPLSNLIREARLTTSTDDAALRDAQLAQIQLNFPLLFLATLQMRKLATIRKWDNVLMAGPHCHLWNDLYNGLRPGLPGAPPASYFYGSHTAQADPSPDYLAYFSHLRAASRSVVAELCGTGAAMRRLIERASTPPTEIVLLCRTGVSPGSDGDGRGDLSADPIETHSVITCAPSPTDNRALKELNPAPHPPVRDMARTAQGFIPVYSPLAHPDELAKRTRAQHEAFAQARALLRNLSGPDIEAMLTCEAAPAIEAIFLALANRSLQSAERPEHRPPAQPPGDGEQGRSSPPPNSRAAGRHKRAGREIAPARAAAAPAIPRLFHFITGLDPNFGGKQFSFVHYMAIRSALELNEGFSARVYYHYDPSGEYWERIKGRVELVRVPVPNEVFGNPVEHYAHKADVLRLRILLEHGGIYLNLDTICQRPFAELLDGRVVMGKEEVEHANGARSLLGLCNALIIAPAHAEFLQMWYETYHDFKGGPSGDAWNKFPVQVPMALARKRPDLLRLEPATSFYWPSWTNQGIDALFSKDLEFPDAFSFHLWESKSWPLLKDLNDRTVATVNTTYNRVARRFLPHQAPVSETMAELPGTVPGMAGRTVRAAGAAVSLMLPKGGVVAKDDGELSRARPETVAEIQKTLSLLTPYAIPGFNKTRVGHDSDGGYVMLNDLDHDMVCCSLGVGAEITWDLELADRGALVFQYDDSVDGPPVSHPNFQFRRVRIAGADNSDAATITIDTIVNAGQEWRNKYVVLKVDIEGGEWEAIRVRRPGNPRHIRSDHSRVSRTDEIEGGRDQSLRQTNISEAIRDARADPLAWK